MTLVQAAIYLGVLSWICFRVHRRVLIKREVRAIRDREMSVAILDPGAEPPVPDQRAELREWRAAWIEPNEEFILETDRILNDIEWARLGSAAQDAGGANDRWEQAS